MIRHLVLIAAIIMATNPHSIARNNFQPGYVILANGDRLEGYLDFRDREKNPRKATFRSTPDGESKVYYPIELHSFGVENERYQTAIVETESSPFLTNQLSKDKEFLLAVDTAFLRTIVDGPVSLFQFKNDAGLDNFYIRNDDGFTLLLHKFYLGITKDGTPVKKEVNHYYSQLASYLKDCPEAANLIRETKYKLADLEDLFKQWYTCTAQEMDFYKQRERLIFEVGALAGISRTQLNISTAGNSFLSFANFKPSYDFTGGIFLDMILTRMQRRLSINSELMWSSYATHSDFEENLSNGFSRPWYVEMKYAYITMNNMIRYRFPVGSLSLYGNIGISNGIAVRSVNTRQKTSLSSSAPIGDKSPAIVLPRVHEQGFLFGLGLKFNRFSVEGRYQLGNGMSSAYGIATRTKRINVLGGFRF